MTAQTPHITAPTAPVRRRRRGDGQIVAIVAGAVLTVAGLIGTVAGIGVLAVFGSDGTANSGTHAFSTPTAALVSEPAVIRDTDDFADFAGDPKFRVSVKSDKPVFVGVGPAKDVDRYLAGAPIDEVTDFEVFPYDLEKDRRPGTKVLGAPGSQAFWVAQNEGRDSATLRWKVRDGDYRLVLMNADGSRGVNAEGDVALTVSHVPTISWSMIGGGVLLLLAGAVTVGLGGRRPGTSRG
jgi:hypothetical protein